MQIVAFCAPAFGFSHLIFRTCFIFGLINRGGCCLACFVGGPHFIGGSGFNDCALFFLCCSWLVSFLPGIDWVWTARAGLTDEMDMGFSLLECFLGSGTRRPDGHLRFLSETELGF